ncbi:MAG: EAL domain-containing protein [Marinobacter sp.]|uniref:EAL domain-containing protein n=1 Tax=Marinobacter sp. TaxID=50741 RepID=UPI00396E6B91
MLHFLDRFSLKTRLLVALGMPLVAIVWMTTMSALSRYRGVSELQEVERFSRLTIQAADLAFHLQYERGASLGYLGGGEDFSSDRLSAARANTDQHLSQFLAYRDLNFPTDSQEPRSAQDGSEEADAASVRYVLTDIARNLRRLSDIRQRIDDFTSSDQEALDYFSRINLQLSSLSTRNIHNVQYADIALQFAALHALTMYRELAGQERGRISYILSDGIITADSWTELLELWAKQRTYYTVFLEFADTEHGEQLQALVHGQRHQDITRLRQILSEHVVAIDSPLPTGILPTAEEWFSRQSDYISQLKVAEDNLAAAILSQTINKRKAASFELWHYLVISPLSILTALILLYLITRSLYLRLKLADIIFNHTHDGIMVTDHQANIIDTNQAFTQITNFTREEVEGKNPRILHSGIQQPDFYKKLWQQLLTTGTWKGEVWNRRKDGELYAELLTISAVHDNSGKPTNYVAIFSDVTEQVMMKQRLVHQATHDMLTGLGNRALFSDRLAHDVEQANRTEKGLAVLFIDLDEFKPINDSLGHRIGDQLLISVANRLQQDLRAGDTLARLGGDEFVLLLTELGHPGEAEEIATRLLALLNKAHKIGKYEFHVSASIGIAIHHAGIKDPGELLQHADMAMYKAKQQGRNTYQFYTDNLDSKLSQRIRMRGELQEAIELGQLSLHYQPMMNGQGEAEGLEALVRWHHPEKGLISPATFIPMAEETGQIIPLSQWVMRQACLDARELAEKRLLKGRVAINLSPLQFHRPDFLNTLRSVLEETKLPTKHLELELTEGILMRDTDGAIDTLLTLNSMGVKTSIDDFGTGFSSLSYLRSLPIDKIKIDRSFVDSAMGDYKSAAICHTIITLCKHLDLKVVAEGIETEEQHDYFEQLGCGVFQGFLFAKPMPLGSLLTWLKHNSRPVSSSR